MYNFTVYDRQFVKKSLKQMAKKYKFGYQNNERF